MSKAVVVSKMINTFQTKKASNGVTHVAVNSGLEHRREMNSKINNVLR